MSKRNLYYNIPNSPNFKYYEFTRSQSALRLNIENIPDDEIIWCNIEKLTQNCLQPIRDKFGAVIITSGYRSPTLNAFIGSTPTSSHVLGESADFKFLNDSIRLIDVIEWTIENIEFRELIGEYLPFGWLHISYRANNNIKRLKLKDSRHNYSVVLIDELKTVFKNI